MVLGLRVTLVSIAVTVCGPTAAGAQQTVAERERTKQHQIRRVTEWRYRYMDGQPAKGVPWSYLEYDRNGNLIVTGRFTTDGRDSPMYVREYDAENRPIKRTWFCKRTDDDPAGEPCLVFRTYRLDNHGNVAEENGYELDDTFVVRVTFLRDDEGRPLEREEYFGEGSSRNRRYRYTYNEQGDAVKILTFDGDGKTIETQRTRYTYDSKGQATSWQVFDADGKRVGGVRQEYDFKGNRTETVDLDAEGRPSRLKRRVYDFWKPETALPKPTDETLPSGPTTAFIRTTWRHEIEDGTATATKHRSMVEYCTEKGESWYELHYNRDGKIVRSYKTLRKDDRDRTLEQVIFYDDYDEPQRLRFEYEDHGLYVLKQDTSKPNAKVTAAILKFDDQGRLILEVWKNKYMTRSYSPTGKLAEFATYYNNGRVTRSVYTYDSHDRLQSVHRTDTHQEGKTIKRCVRDSAGREKELTVTNEHGELIQKHSYTYQTQYDIESKLADLRASNAVARSAAAAGLCYSNDPEQAVSRALAQALKDANAEVRKMAAAALGTLHPPATWTIPNLLESMKDKDALVISNAAYALTLLGPEATPGLEALLGHENETTRAYAVRALAKIQSQRSSRP